MGDVANAVATERDPQKKTVLDLIVAQQPAIAVALPKSMDPERFTRIVLTEVRRNPQLLRCDPMSLLASIMLSSQLGLELGPLGHAFLVPFKDQVTFIIGYRGMINLARRSGEISSIQAYAVHEGDQFSYRLGLDPTIDHVPVEDTAGALTHVYAVAKYKDGGFNFVVLTKDQVDKYRARSASAKSTHSPWVTDYEAMALKTAIRRLWSWLPVTVESAQAMVSDESAPTMLSQDIVEQLALTAPEPSAEEAEVVETEEALV